MGILRMIFAITVVCAHSPWNHGNVFVGGRNAVQLFYMISGFLISYVISTNETYKNPFKFYLSRALRLYPIYYVVAFLTLLATMLVNHKFFELYNTIPTSANVLLIFSNLFLFGQDWVIFSGVHNNHLVLNTDLSQSVVLLNKGLLVPQAWTLGLELSFYALAPFILLNKRLGLLLLILSISIRGYLISAGIGMIDPWSYRFFPAELSFFLFGALSNQYLLPFWKRLISSKDLEWLPKIATYMIISLSLSYFLIPISEYIKTPILILVFLMCLPLTFLYQNSCKLDKAIGELSYPIYIGHVLVIMAIGMLIGHHNLTNTLARSIVNVLATVIFAYFLNKYVAVPVEQFRTQLKSKSYRGLTSRSTSTHQEDTPQIVEWS